MSQPQRLISRQIAKQHARNSATAPMAPLPLAKNDRNATAASKRLGAHLYPQR